MNLHSIQENWGGLFGRVKAQWEKLTDDDYGDSRHHEEVLCGRYGLCRKEAKRSKEEWMKDPGVLDDWNDTRSILDM